MAIQELAGLDPKHIAELERLADEQGKTVEQVGGELIRKKLDELTRPKKRAGKVVTMRRSK